MGEYGAGDVDPGERRVRIEVNVGQGCGSREVSLEDVDYSGNNLNRFVVVLEVEGFNVVNGVDEDEGESMGKVG